MGVTTTTNPGKFQAITAGKHTNTEDIFFSLGENIVRYEDSVKLLGVTMDFSIKF